MNFNQNVIQCQTLGHLLLNLGMSASVWEKIGTDYRSQICTRKIPVQ